MNTLREELEKAMKEARQTYETNRDEGAPFQSIAYDSGRYDGLKQAIEIIDNIVNKQINEFTEGENDE